MAFTFSHLSTAAQSYIGTIVAAGVAALLYSTASLVREPVSSDWLLLAALTLLTGSLTIKVPTVNARLSVSEVFVFGAVLWYGPAVATFIVALDTLVGTFWLRPESRSAPRTLFNVSAGTSAIFVAAHVFETLRPTLPISGPAVHEFLLPVFVLALSYFIVNSLLVATAIAFEYGSSPIEVWRRNFVWLALNYLVGGSIALLLVAYSPGLNLTALGLIVPLLAITYLNFRMSMGRVEDANHHLAQLNELYMSTIEALAMAVDAKDQITHGHIRRVQVYTVELAQRLGVKDKQQLKAIEAAALLHDMGKLAIPEHILNKPGALTAAEFNKMKRHSDIGADLLSSIKFPYPVVPIVRHHHENWDGSGYPSGISGTDIPMGARILSVVDCFDALTSDRPYRPRLTVEDAFKVLRDRRGTMYDPLVVDTFIAVYSEIAPAATLAGQHAKSLVSAFHDLRSDVPALRHISESAAQGSQLSQLATKLEQTESTREAMALIGQYIRLLTPASVCALYRYSAETDSLTCSEATGDGEHLLLGLTMKKGERISGWVAANETIIANSDASLELSQIAIQFRPELHSAIAAPLLVRDRLFGVITAYSAAREPFTIDNQYVFERIATILSNRLAILHSQANGTTIVRFPTTDRR